MKRFTRKQRAWLLVRLNKIAQLKKDCIECNRDNIRLTAENNALRTSDNAKAQRIVDLIGEGQRLRTNRDDWMHQATELRDALHTVRVEDTKLALKVHDLTGQIETLAAALQAAANRHYHEQHIIDEDEILIAGLTALFDRMQARAIKAEKGERMMDTP